MRGHRSRCAARPTSTPTCCSATPISPPYSSSSLSADAAASCTGTTDARWDDRAARGEYRGQRCGQRGGTDTFTGDLQRAAGEGVVAVQPLDDVAEQAAGHAELVGSPSAARAGACAALRCPAGCAAGPAAARGRTRGAMRAALTTSRNAPGTPPRANVPATPRGWRRRTARTPGRGAEPQRRLEHDERGHPLRPAGGEDRGEGAAQRVAGHGGRRGTGPRGHGVQAGAQQRVGVVGEPDVGVGGLVGPLDEERTQPVADRAARRR